MSVANSHSRPSGRFGATGVEGRGVREIAEGEIWRAGRGAARHGLALRHNHGRVCLSGDFQPKIAFLGMTSSPAFVRQPDGNGCLERSSARCTSSSLAAAFRHDRRAPSGAARLQGDVQPRVADRPTRVPFIRAGPPGVGTHARGVIAVNALPNSRAAVHAEPIASRRGAFNCGRSKAWAGLIPVPGSRKYAWFERVAIAPPLGGRRRAWPHRWRIVS